MTTRTTTLLQGISLNALRIATGFFFMQHGAQKLFGLLGGSAVELFSLPGLAGVLEFFGGTLVAIGLFTRPVAFLLSGEMAFAYFMAHAPNGFWPIQNRGELSALFSFVFLFLAFHGGGNFGVDGLLRRARASRAEADEAPRVAVG